METCPQCKGEKVVDIKIHEYDKTTNMSLTCPVCEGEGKVTIEKYREHTDYQDVWCKCDNQTVGMYPEDGECDCGIYKHHVHCGNCGKVSQIG